MRFLGLFKVTKCTGCFELANKYYKLHNQREKT